MAENELPTTPLGARVTAHPVVRPTDTSEVSWRVISPDDVDALHALGSAMAEADHPHWTETREEIAEELSHTWVDLRRDSIVAVDRATGELVAEGLVILPPNPESLVRSILVGGVRPSWRGRGLGRSLLDWQQSRALEQFAASDLVLPGMFMAYCEERAPESARLFERFGFARTRWFLGQQRIIADPIPEIAIPTDVRIERFAPKWSAATLAAKNAAFRDHWGSQPMSEEQWESILSLPSSSAEHSYLAITDTDEVVGVVLTDLPRDDWERQGFTSGYIPTVGVVREWRRKGLAPALLARVFQSLREAGIERVDLDVDSDNPTGALGLYTGMGFVETNRIVTMTKSF